MHQIRNFRFLLIVLFLLSSLASAVAQTAMIPVSIPVNGQFVFPGRLASASGSGHSQLFVVDTATGATYLKDENASELRWTTWSHEGTQFAYLDGFAPTIQNVSTSVKTPLGLPAGYIPVDWSPDDNNILFRRYIFDEQPERYTLEIFTIANSGLTPLFGYQVGEQLAVTMPPSLPQGVTDLTLASVDQAQWNPTHPEWILVQLDTRGMPNPESHPTIRVNFLFNSQTSQTISLDDVVTSPIVSSPVRWSPDGRYLTMHTLEDDGKVYVNVVSFENVGGSWQLNLLDSAQADGSIVNWLGAGDLLLASRGNAGDDRVYSIAQIIDGTLQVTEFFRIPRSTFAADGPSDWHITASETEKQTLTCLFDQALVTRLETGMRARVNFTDGTPLRLREAPLVYSSEILQMPEGTEFDVLGGPVCANGYRWWQVELDDSTVGWAAEADNESYFIEPLSTNQSPTSNAGPDQTLTDSDGNDSELVTLDGSGSSDPDGTIVSYSWSENDIEIATGVSPQVSLSVGVHTIILTVTDDGGATATDEVIITVNPAPQMPGTGLRGQYFDALNFSTLKFFRIVPTIDFNWGTGSPATGAIAVDTFSIRWTGQVEPLYSETYTFYSTHNDGARLWVNGQQLVNDWVNRSSAVEKSGTISLTAGVKYDIVLEYYENTGSASVKLEWSSPSQTRQVIPASQLYPPEGQLAFTGRTSGNDDIFLVNPDGSGEINLSNHSAAEDSAAWSPDGTKLAFVSQRDGNKEIYLINADGTGLRRLTNHSTTDDHIAWSPDGTQIAFHSARTAGGDIYKLSVAGTGIPTATRLTTNADAEQNPIWSPNGLKIIYERNVGGSNPEIYMMNPDGTSQTRLTNRAGYDVSPFVSPDGSKIAIRSNYGAVGDEIVIITISPLSVVRVTNNNTNDYFQSWSSDSSKILFMSTRDGNAEVYSMNADGSNQTRLTNSPQSESYAVWSADSREIAFIRSGDIWLMNADGSNQRNFSNTPSRTEREIVWWQAKQTY